MELLLRDARLSDLSAVARIQRLCFFGEPTDPRMLGEITTTVAEIEGIVAGYCISSFDMIPSRLVVLSLAVHPEYRRIGVATQLLEAIQGAAVIADRRVRVIAGTNNWALSAVLHSVGFRITSQISDLRMFEWGGDKHDDARKSLVRRLSGHPAGRSLPR